MPLYEYECGSCRERTEVIQRFSDAPLELCSSCGGALRKLISSPAIQFKGSGFYITDYSRSSGKEGTAGTEAKPDSKPAAESSGGASPATPAATGTKNAG